MTKIGLIAVVSPRYPALRVVITTAPNSTMTRNRSRAFRHGTGSWHVDVPVCERARGHARALLAQSGGEAQGGKVRFLAFALKLASMSLRNSRCRTMQKPSGKVRIRQLPNRPRTELQEIAYITTLTIAVLMKNERGIRMWYRKKRL